MNKRLESVDILRGFTIAAMILVNTPGSWSHVYSPLLHAEWHGSVRSLCWVRIAAGAAAVLLKF